MKRDMDLIRELLMWMEDQPAGYVGKVPDFPGRSSDEVGYHFHLMMQAGLIDGMPIRSLSLSSPMVRPTALTYAGHDFIEHARNDTRWNRAKQVIIETGRSMTVESLMLALKALAGG